eukprot:g6231.t1
MTSTENLHLTYTVDEAGLFSDDEENVIPDDSFYPLPQQDGKDSTRKRTIYVGVASLLLIAVVASVGATTLSSVKSSNVVDAIGPLGKIHPNVDPNALPENEAKVKAEFQKELKILQPYLLSIIFGAGIFTLLFGKRLFVPTITIAGAATTAFVSYSLTTSVTLGVASWDAMSAANKVAACATLSTFLGLLAGYLVAKLQKLGVAALAGAAAFLGGEFLYQVFLEQQYNNPYGQYAVGGTLAVVAFMFVFVYESELLAVSSSAFGALVTARAGAKLFFNYVPTTSEFNAHWNAGVKVDIGEIQRGTDEQFWLFVASVVGLFALGLFSQLYLEPKICPSTKKTPESATSSEDASIRYTYIDARTL